MTDISFIEKPLLTGKTAESAFPSELHDDRLHWGYTGSLVDVIAAVNRKASRLVTPTPEKMYYRGYRVIGRDTPINKGILLWGNSHGFYGESMVVDDVKQEQLRFAVETLDRMMRLPSGRLNLDYKSQIFDYILQIVTKTIKYDKDGLEGLYKKYNISPGDEVTLQFHILHGVGVCRHQALFGAYLLEKLIQQRYLKGTVSLERNFDSSGEGHAWIRYMFPNGQVYIIDSARRFFATLQEANQKGNWNYLRPNDAESI